MVSATTLENGVAAVTTILLAVKLHAGRKLAWEAWASVLLTVGSIAIQIVGGKSVERSYEQRRGASSGLVLGTLTPIWVASGLTLRDGQLDNTFTIARAILDSTLIFAAMSLLFIATRSALFGLQKTFNQKLGMVFLILGWISSGLGGIFVDSELLISALMCAMFHLLMVKVPHSLTIGEGLLLVQGTRYACRPALIALARDGWFLSATLHQEDSKLQSPTVNSVMTSMIGLIALLAAVSFGLLLLPAAEDQAPMSSKMKKTVLVTEQTKNKQRTSTRSSASLGSGFTNRRLSLIQMVPCLIATAILVSLAVTPVHWVFVYVTLSPERLKVLLFWATTLALSLPAMKSLSTCANVRKIMVRKGYHALAVTLFLPALMTQADLLSVALAGAFAVLVVVEILRLANIPKISSQVHQFMSAFVDARDSGAFYVTHFTLLLGLAIPIWLSLSVNKTTNDTSTFPESLAGILSTGIGDAAASIIGSSFGRVRIAGDSRKTLEGTVAGATAMLMSSWGMAQLWPKSPRSYNVWQLVVSTLLSALLEASTDQFDNIFVSLHFFSLLCALH